MRATDIKAIGTQTASINNNSINNKVEEKELVNTIDLDTMKMFCRIYTGIQKTMVVGKTVVLAHRTMTEDIIPPPKDLTDLVGIFTIEKFNDFT